MTSVTEKKYRLQLLSVHDALHARWHAGLAKMTANKQQKADSVRFMARYCSHQTQPAVDLPKGVQVRRVDLKYL